MPIRQKRIGHNGKPFRLKRIDRVKPLPLGDWRHGPQENIEIKYWYSGEPKVIKRNNYLGGKSYGYFSEGRFVLHRSDGPAFTIGKRGHLVSPVFINQWYRHGIELEKDDFDSIEMVNQMKAWELFTPHEIAKLKNAKNRNKTKNLK